jgi:hypothetical protein
VNPNPKKNEFGSTTLVGALLEADDNLLLLQDFELAEVEQLHGILHTGECWLNQTSLPNLGKVQILTF